MKCDSFREAISASMDGRPGDAAANHLAECPECREWRAETAAAMSLLDRIPRVPLPTGFGSRLGPPPRSRRLWKWAACAALLISAAAAALVLTRLSPDPELVREKLIEHTRAVEVVARHVETLDAKNPEKEIALVREGIELTRLQDNSRMLMCLVDQPRYQELKDYVVDANGLIEQLISAKEPSEKRIRALASLARSSNLRSRAVQALSRLGTPLPSPTFVNPAATSTDVSLLASSHAQIAGGQYDHAISNLTVLAGQETELRDDAVYWLGYANNAAGNYVEAVNCYVALPLGKWADPQTAEELRSAATKCGSFFVNGIRADRAPTELYLDLLSQKRVLVNGASSSGPRFSLLTSVNAPEVPILRGSAVQVTAMSEAAEQFRIELDEVRDERALKVVQLYLEPSAGR
jgi:hypothetical protein